jgi:hypothetical protein
MDHLNVDRGIDAIGQPGTGVRSVERGYRRKQVLQRGVSAPGDYAGGGVWVRVDRLPLKVGVGRQPCKLQAPRRRPQSRARYR